MSTKKIRDAIETKLKALAGSSVNIAFENKPFAPTLNKPYLDATLLPAMTQNPSLGVLHKREIGVYRINVRFPTGDGPAAAMAWAEVLRDGFKRGTTLTSDGVTVFIPRDPYLAPAISQPDWYTIPVQVPYQADILQ